MRPDHWSIQIPSDILAYIGGIFIVLLMIQVVLDVAGREIFGLPIDGTLEIVSFYYMVGVTFLPLAYVSHEEGHIMVEMFTRKLSRPRLAGLEAVIGIMCFALVVVLVTQSWDAALDSYETEEMWETSDDLITIWPSRFALPIGVFMMGVYMVYRIADDILIALGKRDGGETQ
ncbi:MAG: TRAP transporter small permease [Rhodospirillales bacterium]|nr:TRAP transporter small permease [Rhodospirillales bacterium]